tara:strand:+ start:50117 stop:50320 length:204 start_codon:yes stop_codon:yes gene_type:complete
MRNILDLKRVLHQIADNNKIDAFVSIRKYGGISCNNYIRLEKVPKIKKNRFTTEVVNLLWRITDSNR